MTTYITHYWAPFHNIKTFGTFQNRTLQLSIKAENEEKIAFKLQMQLHDSFLHFSQTVKKLI